MIPMISIHAPRGGSDDETNKKPTVEVYFNPRSPWGERPLSLWSSSFLMQFQSTLPVGGATTFCHYNNKKPGISIHAPRGGSDPERCKPGTGLTNFNPRSPWGERLSP